MAFLVSESAGYITGQGDQIDGGMVLSRPPAAPMTSGSSFRLMTKDPTVCDVAARARRHCARVMVVDDGSRWDA